MSNKNTLEIKQQRLSEIKNIEKTYPQDMRKEIANLWCITESKSGYAGKVLSGKKSCTIEFSYFNITFTIKKDKLEHILNIKSYENISLSSFKTQASILHTVKENIHNVTFDFINNHIKNYQKTKKELNILEKEIIELQKEKSLEDNKGIVNKIHSFLKKEDNKSTEKDLPQFIEYVTEQDIVNKRDKGIDNPYIKEDDIKYNYNSETINNNINRINCLEFITFELKNEQVIFKSQELLPLKQSNGIRYHVNWEVIAKKKAIELMNKKLYLNGKVVRKLSELPFYQYLTDNDIIRKDETREIKIGLTDFQEAISPFLMKKNIGNF